MFCQDIGNGACGTNCGSIHTMEGDSEEAMISMKRMVNNHMDDNYDNIYKNIIGIPYTESVFGEENRQTCNTPQEVNDFLRSDRASRYIQTHAGDASNGQNL